jgi:hypothetical protein
MQSQDDQPPDANDATLVAPRAQQGSARLILRKPDGQLKEYGLEKEETTIGRLAANDVALPDDRTVSRRHAVIRRSNVGYVIEDQQSNNGTYVDGEKILYPFVLHNGQSIKVGANELTFTLTSAPVRSGPQGGLAPVAPEIQPAPQPAAFGPPPQPAPPIDQPQPQATFQQPQGAPSFPQFAQPPAPEPAPFPAAPPPQFGIPPAVPGPQFSPAPNFQAPSAQSSTGAGMVVCQNCGNPTMANKAFCLNCGASMAAQNVPAPQFGGSAPQFPPSPGAGFGQPPAGGPQPWPPQPQGQPQPGPQPWSPQPQGWPGQPGQFGAPAPAPAEPLDATVFFPKGLRPLQPSDIRVRLATQFVAPGGLQPGAAIIVRIWSTAQDAFYFSGPGITLRVPAPGNAEEGSLQVTPLRPTAPGATDQLLLMAADANTGQSLHPAPLAVEVVISYQPAPPFDGPGSARLPI